MVQISSAETLARLESQMQKLDSRSADAPVEALAASRAYMADYIFGAFAGPAPAPAAIGDEHGSQDYMRYGIFFPGNAINHNPRRRNIAPSPVYESQEEDTEGMERSFAGFDLIALRSMGDELFEDYSTFGPVPDYVQQWKVAVHVVEDLTFPGSNMYVAEPGPLSFAGGSHTQDVLGMDGGSKTGENCGASAECAEDA